MPMVFEIRTAEVIQSCLPGIEQQLKRIADALEAANEAADKDRAHGIEGKGK